MAIDYPIAAADTSGNSGGKCCSHDNVRDPSSTVTIRTAAGAEDAETARRGKKGVEAMISRAFCAPNSLIFPSPLARSFAFETRRTTAFSASSAVKRFFWSRAGQRDRHPANRRKRQDQTGRRLGEGYASEPLIEPPGVLVIGVDDHGKHRDFLGNGKVAVDGVHQ